MEKGIVKFFNASEGKRFGFVRTESGEEIFFHFGDGAQIFAGSFVTDKSPNQDPQKGDEIVFLRADGRKGPKASPWAFANESHRPLPKGEKMKVKMGEHGSNFLELKISPEKIFLDAYREDHRGGKKHFGNYGGYTFPNFFYTDNIRIEKEGSALILLSPVDRQEATMEKPAIFKKLKIAVGPEALSAIADVSLVGTAWEYGPRTKWAGKIAGIRTPSNFQSFDGNPSNFYLKDNDQVKIAAQCFLTKDGLWAFTHRQIYLEPKPTFEKI